MEDTAQILRNHGTHVASIEHGGLKVSLYTINGEHYEVFYNVVEDRIVKVAQASKGDLDKYSRVRGQKHGE